MKINESAAYLAELTTLRGNYLRQTDTVLHHLEEYVAECGPDISDESLINIRDKLHRLAGSGGTFGFPKLSSAAREVEETVESWLAHKAPISPAAWSAWQLKLLVLRQAIENSEDQNKRVAERADLKDIRDAEGKVSVVLIEDDEDIARKIYQGLEQFGYDVAHYTGFEAAREPLLAAPPDMLVVDIMLPGQTPADGTEGVAELFATLGYQLPALFLSALTGFAPQMAAARVGGLDFMPKPVDVPQLAGRIESLLRNPEDPPFRILVVDDDEILAEHYRLTLAASGMVANKVCDSTAVLAAMEQLQPDLVLLDLYMPGYTGAELARAMRFGNRWQGLPVIYLSAEQDRIRQHEALASGADDFLTKPISDSQLVTTVRVRAARARKISDLMRLDSLTGLLKHSSIKERIGQEADRARRQAKPMSVAMIDIDHFKRVNDTYGHPMGDQVIKTLAHLLRQRLRRQDSVGRYGGEEFAAVLPECNAESAKLLLEDIRKRISEIPFLHNDTPFNVTISVGVACSEDFSWESSMLEHADQALYVAKHGGRNQVRNAVPLKIDDETKAQRVLRLDKSS